MAFSYLLARFYRGNRDNAERQAKARNASIDRALALDLLGALEEAPRSYAPVIGSPAPPAP